MRLTGRNSYLLLRFGFLSVERISLVFWKYKRMRVLSNRQASSLQRSILDVPHYHRRSVLDDGGDKRQYDIFLVYSFELCCSYKLPLMTHELSHSSPYCPISSKNHTRKL